MLSTRGRRSTSPSRTDHLASWAGMCPGQHESAGKSKEGTYLASQYHRLAGRRGKMRARKAVGHNILVAVWHILSGPETTFVDLGPDWFDRRNSPALRARRKHSELRGLGCAITTNDDGSTTVVLPAA